MNKIFRCSTRHIEIERNKYIFLLSILIVGIISGLIFIFFISYKDKLLIHTEIKEIVNIITNHKLNYLKTFINSISSNLLSLFCIYLLGISIIGMPLIILFIYIKGFTFGFSISSFIHIYHFKGLIGCFLYLFPHSFILLIVWILLGYYGINFSTKLFRYLFLKENINLSRYFIKYNKILILCLILVFIASLSETFISPILVDLCL